jgi:hypothetical protein
MTRREGSHVGPSGSEAGSDARPDAEPADAGTAGAGGPGALAILMVPLGILLGCVAYWVLMGVVGVPVEVWEGVETFTQPRWFAAVAFVPAVAGLVTGVIAGDHGKWYGMLPVAIMHPVEYFRLASGANPDVHVLGFGLFVFFMLVMLELGLMAGWAGEIFRHRLKGREVRA